MAGLQGSQVYRNWGLSEHLLAGMIDAVNMNTYVLHSAHSKKKSKPPKPVERPGARAARKKTNEFAMAMQAKAARKATQ